MGRQPTPRIGAVAAVALGGAAVIAALFAAATFAINGPHQIVPVDQRAAKAAVIHLGDLYNSSAWKGGPHAPDNSEWPSCGGYTPSFSHLVVTGDAFSRFSGGGEIGSEATIYQTAQFAQAAWDQFHAPGYLRCHFSTDGVTKGEKANKVEMLPVKIGSRSDFVRESTVGSSPLKFVGDLVFFGQGRCNGLFVFGTANSTALANAAYADRARQLAALMMKRLRRSGRC